MDMYRIALAVPRRFWSHLKDLFLPLLVQLLIVQLALVPGAQAAGLLGSFSIKDEVELGRKFDLLVRSRLPMVEDPEITGYVKELIERLVKVMPPQPFDIKSSVVMANSINAFAAPAGFVFVHTGLILNFNKESEVAAVIAHELAHVSQRHIARRIERMQTISILSMLGMLAGAFLGGEHAEAVVVGSAAAAQAAMLKYSRDDEREADEVGMNYLIASNYPVQGLVSGFKTILKLQWLSGGGSIPSYLTTHPALQERIGYLEQRINRLPEDVRTRKEDETRFRRVQTILRARYSDADSALLHWSKPENTRTWLDLMGLAIVCERLKKVTQARETFQKALAKGGNDPLLQREMGIFLFKMGEFGAAAQYLQRAIVEAPNDLMALFYYARLQADLGKTDEAVDYLERVRRHVPEDAEVHYYLGRIQGEGRDYFQAHLHLAYSALYANNARQCRFHKERTEKMIRTETERKQYNDFEKIYKERSEFWSPLDRMAR